MRWTWDRTDHSSTVTGSKRGDIQTDAPTSPYRGSSTTSPTSPRRSFPPLRDLKETVDRRRHLPGATDTRMPMERHVRRHVHRHGHGRRPLGNRHAGGPSPATPWRAAVPETRTSPRKCLGGGPEWRGGPHRNPRALSTSPSAPSRSPASPKPATTPPTRWARRRRPCRGCRVPSASGPSATAPTGPMATTGAEGGEIKALHALREPGAPAHRRHRRTARRTARARLCIFDGKNDLAFMDHDPKMAVTQGTIAFWTRPDDLGDWSIHWSRRTTRARSTAAIYPHRDTNEGEVVPLRLAQRAMAVTNKAWTTKAAGVQMKVASGRNVARCPTPRPALGCSSGVGGDGGDGERHTVSRRTSGTSLKATWRTPAGSPSTSRCR